MSSYSSVITTPDSVMLSTTVGACLRATAFEYFGRGQASSRQGGMMCDTGDGGHPDHDPCCRRDADETAHYGSTRLSMAGHVARAKPWTVQHFRAYSTIGSHACMVFPKPGAAGSIPAGGTNVVKTTTFPPANSHLPPTRSLLTSQPASGADSDRRRTLRLPTVVSARHLSAVLGGRHIPSVGRRWPPRLSARMTCCCRDRRP